MASAFEIDMTLDTDNKGNPILEQFSEEGFIDCVLRITDLKEQEDHFCFHLSASSDNEIVGIDARVYIHMKSGFDSDMNLIQEHVYRSGVTFSRSGAESDRLISRLATLYGLPDRSFAMVPSEPFTAIALHQGDIDLRSQGIKIKIFGHDKEPIDEDIYNESFFNLDIKNGLVYWNEKDQDYRNPLIKGLTE